MTELKKKLKELIIKTVIIVAIETVILSFFFSYESLWVLWGGLGAILGFYSLAEEIKRMEVGSKVRKILPGFFLRYLLYGIILGIAAYNSLTALMLSFLGLINMKVSVYLSYK